MTSPSTQYFAGTAMYNGSPATLEEYIERVKKHGKGDVEYFMRERQPAYMAHNYYGDGAEAFEFEQDSVMTETASGVQIIEEEDGLYLEITLDERFETLATDTITTEYLGVPRITEEVYENPDGTPICIDTDLLGKARGERPTAGPIEGLCAGKQRIKIWNK